MIHVKPSTCRVLGDALGAVTREPVAVLGTSGERVEADSLRGNVDTSHRVVERIHSALVGGPVDRVEVDGFVGTDDRGSDFIGAQNRRGVCRRGLIGPE